MTLARSSEPLELELDPPFVLNDHQDDYLTQTIMRPARECFSLFAYVERMPEWFRAVRSAAVLARDATHRPIRATFLADMTRATVGFTCTYRYSRRGLHVAWSTPEGSALRLHGFARFQPLELRSCLMTFCLGVDRGTLPPFADEPFALHPASTAIADFRDYAVGMLRK